MRLASAAVVLLLLAAGCLGTSPDEDDGDDAIAAPAWETGQWWTYAVVIPEAEVVTTMVVGDVDETNYHLGSSQRVDAQRHAVLNHNPALGRVRVADMALYEKNEPQLLLQFPLTAGASWNFSLFGVDRFDATITAVGDGRATIVAESPSGDRLEYVYDRASGWLTSFVHSEAGGELLRMTLVEAGTGYSGEAWFCRGGDLYEGKFSGPDFEFYDTAFANDGHVRYGPWSYVVYWLEEDIRSGSGELVLRDHDGAQLTRVYAPGNSHRGLGVVTGASGNWTLQVSLSGNADVRLVVAGAIEYGWTL